MEQTQPKLSTVHEAVTRAALGHRYPPGDRAVMSAKVPADLAERAERILGHHGTNVNAYLGACVALLVEDYERATQG